MPDHLDHEHSWRTLRSGTKPPGRDDPDAPWERYASSTCHTCSATLREPEGPHSDASDHAWYVVTQRAACHEEHFKWRCRVPGCTATLTETRSYDPTGAAWHASKDPDRCYVCQQLEASAPA